jgi:CubicO group peptidase (beta-lactamase class C family)
VTHHGHVVALKALGSFTYGPDSPDAGAPVVASFAKSGAFPMQASTLFDLASLTKVVATTSAAMLLYERGLLDLEAPVAAIVPEFISDVEKDSRRREVTVRMLLAHCSGLPAYEKLFLKARTRDALLHSAFTMPLAANPGARADYSDIGFIILGIALERLAGESLDRYAQHEIFGPLGMTNTTFNPPAEIRDRIPPTADERPCGADTPVRKTPTSREPSRISQQATQQPTRSTFRQRIIQGEVQDENASVLGGVAAHAGLFSTSRDLAQFAHSMLNPGNPIFRPQTVALFTRRESMPADSSRALGWDTPSVPSQAGKYFSPAAFGHLGYTGTSLWIDPTRQLSITLLTNRTWPDCANHAIKQVRPRLHDAVVEALENPA